MKTIHNLNNSVLGGNPENDFGSIPISSEVLVSSNIGVWAFELDEGKEPRMYVNDAMLNLIGLDAPVSPEKTYHAWYDYIDEGSYGLVADAVEKMTAGEHAEVQYPWHYPDGRTIIVRCGGVRNFAYKKGIRIEGIHQDVTKVLHLDEKELEAIRQKENEFIISNIRTEALAFVSDNNPDENKFIDFFGNKILKTFHCDQVVFFDKDKQKTVFNATGIESIPDELCDCCSFEKCRGSEEHGTDGTIVMDDTSKGYNGNFVNPNCPVKSSIVRQVFVNDKLVGWLNVKFIKEAHSFTKDEIKILETISDYFGILLERINQKKFEEERLARELAEIASRQDREIIEILASEYSSVYYIDLTTDTLTPYTMNEETETTFGSVFRSGITYSEAYGLYVDKLIYSYDKFMMLKAGSIENIKKELSGKKTFITTYRNSENEYCEMKFVKVGGEYDKPEAVALGFAEKDQQLREEQEAKRYSEIANALSERYDSIYYVNTEDDSYIHFHSNDSYSEHIDENGEDFFENCKKNLLSLTLPEDRSAVLDFIDKEKLMKSLKAGSAYIPQYKLTYSGQSFYYSMRAVKPSPDEPHIIVAVTNINEEVEAREKEQAIKNQNFEIIEILASEYSSVYYIDLTTDGLTPYTMNEDTETTFGSVFRSGITYSEAYRLYVDKLVFPEDKTMMLNAGSIGNIMKELRTKKTFLTTYRSAEGHYSEMKFVKVGNEEGTPVAVALGFADKDEELRAKQEEERVLQRNIDIIEILASEYSSVYYIDMTTDELDPYTMNEQTESQFGDIFRSGIKYSDAFKMYVDKLVYPQDKERMLKAGSIYNILNELSNKKTFLTQYRSSDGEYCEMKFVKVGEEENPQSVALGFSNKNDEIRSEIERREKQERDNAVITGLSGDFGCVVYTDFYGYDEVHYRFDPLFAKHIDGWSNITNFKDRLEKLMNTIMHPDDREQFWAATRPEVVREATEKYGVYYVNFRTLVDGEEIYYQAKFVRDENRPETNVIAGFHNVDTETKREMETLEKARSANKAKTDFLFNMSHDIRTPMNAIMGFTDMAMKNINDKEKVVDSLKKTQLAGELLLSLINNILDMSRIESGKITPDENEGDVMLSFASIEGTMEELAKKKNINLSFNIGKVTDRYVYCDLSRCNRIFVNIITNAIKYTNEGGYVKVNCEQIDKKGSCAIYKYTFEDNGIGMSEEFVKRAFDEFSRENTATVSGVQGTGLGLSVCKSFVNAMNGTIECYSKQGEGTTFVVTLPFKIQEGKMFTDPKNGSVVSKDKTPKIDFGGKRVLLVEDNELNLEISEFILRNENMEVEVATDGTFAVQKLKEKGPDYYDFILMDIQMPIMDGYVATGEIRKMYPNSDLPIIAVSANAFSEDKAASISAGMNDHIAKPINVDELRNVMSKYIK